MVETQYKKNITVRTESFYFLCCCISISLPNHKMDKFVCDEMFVTIDRIGCIIFRSRSYFFDKSRIFHKFCIRFRFYFVLDVWIHLVIRPFFVEASKFNVLSLHIILEKTQLTKCASAFFYINFSQRYVNYFELSAAFI